jgi:hypothetical protein
MDLTITLFFSAALGPVSTVHHLHFRRRRRRRRRRRKTTKYRRPKVPATF